MKSAPTLTTLLAASCATATQDVLPVAALPASDAAQLTLLRTRTVFEGGRRVFGPYTEWIFMDHEGQWCRGIESHLWCESAEAFWGWSDSTDAVYLQAEPAPLDHVTRADRFPYAEVLPLPATLEGRFRVVADLVGTESRTVTLVPTQPWAAWWQERGADPPSRAHDPILTVTLTYDAQGAPLSAVRTSAGGRRFVSEFHEVHHGDDLVRPEALRPPPKGEAPALWEQVRTTRSPR